MSSKTPESSDAKTESEPKTVVILLSVLAVMVMIAAYIAFGFLSDKRVTINGQKLDVTVASTSEARDKGLGGRERLASNQGMLFEFATASKYCFWMQDMKFSIDMIWLDQNKKVVSVKENATPESYPEAFCPDEDAQYVLEVPAGSAKQWNIKEGDQAQF